MNAKSSVQLRKFILSAFFMSIGLVLPFITGQIPQIGKMLSPMHIPVFLCGFICGAPYGALVGLITPPLRAVLFGMPALFPQSVGMAFELCTYGLVSGLLYSLFKRLRKGGIVFIYVTLILSMICGRIVWGIASFILYGITGAGFTFEMFLAGALINAVPGIILHLIMIPAIVIALEKAGLTKAFENPDQRFSERRA